MASHVSIILLVVLTVATLALVGYGLSIHLGVEESAKVSAIPWGLLVPGYVFFALVATGSSIVNSIYTVFGYRGPREGFEKIIRYGVWFSLASIVPAWLLILSDLTHTGNMLWMLLSFQPMSRIAWMGLLYGLFALALVIELVYMIRASVDERLRAMKSLELAIAIAVLVVTIAVHSNLGQVFGTIAAVPGWYGPHLAPYFIASAVLIGGAGQLLYILASTHSSLASELKEFFTSIYGKVFVIGVPVLAFFMIWNALTAYYYPEAWKAYHEIMFGSHATGFWLIEVGLGIIASLTLAVIAVRTKNLQALVAAAILLLIAGFVSKCSLIIIPQEARLETETGTLTLDGVAYQVEGYEPSLSEILLLAGATTLWPLLLLLGNLLLPLAPNEKPRRLWILK